MDYILCKELKDAGFPIEHSWNFYRPNGDCEDAACANFNEAEDAWILELSVLIGACGEEFVSLERSTDGTWRVKGTRDVFGKKGFELNWDYGFKTPEEAVARLWLALNKK